MEIATNMRNPKIRLTEQGAVGYRWNSLLYAVSLAVVVTAAGCNGLVSDPTVSASLKKGRAIAAATEVGVTVADLRSKVQEFYATIAEVENSETRDALKEVGELYKDSITLMEALAQPKIYMFEGLDFVNKKKSGKLNVRKNGERPTRDDEAAAYMPLYEVTSKRSSLLAVEEDAERWVISKDESVQKLWVAAEKLLKGIK